jgi:hypothetical protein
LALLVIGGMAGAMWVSKRQPVLNPDKMPDGYVSDLSALKQEFDHYYGASEAYGEVSSRFQSAADLAAKRNFPAVASVLESVSKKGSVPLIFHDMGVAYAGLADFPRATVAFREALARDPEYGPTRKFLRDARGIAPGSAEPFTRELEPNDSNVTANLIPLRAPVGGEITGAADAADFYRVNAPPPPRDLIAIEVANHSASLAAHLRVFDANMKIQSWGDESAGAGQSIKVTGGPTPNSSVYLSVGGGDGQGGAYLITVTPMKAFDRYEPNDDIMSSRKISIGEEISANIMDSADSDFFSFASPRQGQATVEIRNRAETFVPALAVYNMDRRNIGFAPDVKPGANMRHSFDVDKDRIYYLHISAHAGAAGPYILRVD